MEAIQPLENGKYYHIYNRGINSDILFKEKRPNVVLLDGGLQGTMSIDLLKEFKAPNENTTVIILDNNMGNHEEEKCKSLGADYFFDKYNDFEKIPAFITSISGKYQ